MAKKYIIVKAQSGAAAKIPYQQSQMNTPDLLTNPRTMLSFALSPQGRAAFKQWEDAGYTPKIDDAGKSATFSRQTSLPSFEGLSLSGTGGVDDFFNLTKGIGRFDKKKQDPYNGNFADKFFGVFNPAARMVTRVADQSNQLKQNRKEKQDFIKALQPEIFDPTSEEGLNQSPIFTAYGGKYEIKKGEDRTQEAVRHKALKKKKKKQTGGDVPCYECEGNYEIGEQYDLSPEQMSSLKELGYEFEETTHMDNQPIAAKLGYDSHTNEFTILI